MSSNVYWFRRKRFGWGWGLPCSWQGWTFFILWLASLIFAAVHFMPQRSFAFTMALAALTVILVAVCIVKGEPLDNDPG
jgi:peptidoglycan/LPS O-acetylase OafA/YrhL